MDNYSTGERRSPNRSLRGHARFEHRSRWVPRLLWLLGVAVLFTASTGCATFQGVRDYIQYNDATDDFVVGWRNYVWANKAWAAQKDCYYGQPHLADFGEGFRAGYRNVAAGGDGCPPPLPPRNYWNWKHQSPEGQAKIAAWFSGYPYGAAAAEQEGAGNWREIPVSHVIQQMYSPEFQQGLTHCGGQSQFFDPHGPMLPREHGGFDAEPPMLRELPSGSFPGHQDSSMQIPHHMMLPPVNPEPASSNFGAENYYAARFIEPSMPQIYGTAGNGSSMYVPTGHVTDQNAVHGYHP